MKRGEIENTSFRNFALYLVIVYIIGIASTIYVSTRNSLMRKEYDILSDTCTVPCPRCEGSGQVSLTERYQAVYNLASRAEGVTSREVSDRLTISIQNASNKLNKLHSIGLLRRVFRDVPSGGNEYVFRRAER